MKLFISADIEGVTDVTSWNETALGNIEHENAARQMEREVNAVCQGALQIGFREMLVNDAHDSGRNMNHHALIKEASLVRSWSGHPFSMMDGLDKSFSGICFVGYHNGASMGNNPLAHTFSSSKVQWIKINGVMATEFLFNYYTGAYLGVPTYLVVGDEGVCKEAQRVDPSIEVVITKRGTGYSTYNFHPEKVLEDIEKKMKSLDVNKFQKPILPEKFVMEIFFKEEGNAYKGSFYPGMELVEPHLLRYSCEDYMELLTARHFVI